MNYDFAYYTKSLSDSDPAGPTHIVAFETSLCGKDLDPNRSPGRWFYSQGPATCRKCLKILPAVDNSP